MPAAVGSGRCSSSERKTMLSVPPFQGEVRVVDQAVKAITFGFHLPRVDTVGGGALSSSQVLCKLTSTLGDQGQFARQRASVNIRSPPS